MNKYGRRSGSVLAAVFALSFALTHQGWLAAREPFGAEDRGAEDNFPSIPEPMVFDLVRPLGADAGELEVNVLAEFPLGSSQSEADDFDPIGLTPSSRDRDGIEWAPEIEYAIRDGFALEFELPFENSTLEAYKFAAQWTFRTALQNRFIDGAQVIVEPDTDFETWDLTFLYLAGMQFNRRWSALGMVGFRPEIEEGRGVENTDGLLNLTVFRDLTNATTVGIETNFTFGDADRTTFLIIPQVDVELTDNMELQFGGGAGIYNGGTKPLVALRAIYSR